MIRPLLVTASVVVAALSGCAALPGAQTLVAAAQKAASAKKPATPKGRTISIAVTGPADLATGEAIVAKGGAGLFDKGGNIIAAGAGNLVAAGAGNLVAAGAGNLVAAGAGNFRLGAGFAPRFRLAASTTGFPTVTGAGLQLLGLDGKPVGKAVEVDEDGVAKLPAVPDGKVLTAVAAFQVGEAVYRMAVVVPTGKLGGPLMADPINTMVEARVKDLVGEDGVLPVVTGAKLKRVWDICHGAGVTVKPEDLAAQDPAASRAALTKVWQAAIDAKVTNADEKAEIKAFMAEIKAAVEAKQAEDAE